MRTPSKNSAITKIQAAIITVIIIIALIVGVYYATLPGPSPSPTASPSPSPTPTVSPTARVVRLGNAWPIYLDPAVGQDFASQRAQVNVYDPLVWPEPNGTISPWVAENWTISADGLVYTFKIRQGITFHTGRTLTAEDVAFSMNRCLTIGTGYGGFLWSPFVQSAVALNSTHVQFTLKKVFAPFLASLIRLFIVDKAEVMAHIQTPGPYGELGDYATQWMLTNDAGSGPYKVKEIRLQDYVHVEIFSNYWAGGFATNAPTEVIFLPTSAIPATEKTMMLLRQLEVSDQWQSQEWLDELDAAEGISKKSQPCAGEYYYMLNVQRPPLDDVHVRKALAYCFDYATAMATIYPRFSQAKSCLPMSLPGAIESQVYYYNLTKAAEELALSKYASNISQYTIYFDVMPEVPERQRDALLLVEGAAQIGINIEIVNTPWLQYIEKMSNMTTCPHITCMAISAYFPDAAFMLYTKYHSSSAGHVDQGEWLLDDALDAMIEDALATLNETERLQKVAQIQQYIMDICPTIFVYDWYIVEAVQDYVRIPSFEDPDQAIKVEGYSTICRTWSVTPH
ncbi:MAG: ABC transporter substrate-binding protein [Candidatus Bathycorpusculaceae bacterium]